MEFANVETTIQWRETDQIYSTKIVNIYGNMHKNFMQLGERADFLHSFSCSCVSSLRQFRD
jgi:hypothetical protein